MGVARVGRMRGLAAILVGVLLLLLPRRSWSDSIEIVTTDGMPWASLVEQIQDDAHSEGRHYQLVVRDGGVAVPCSDYQLSLDAVAAAAFRVVGCETAISATALRLVNRAALFAEGDALQRCGGPLHAADQERGCLQSIRRRPVAGHPPSRRFLGPVALPPRLGLVRRGRRSAGQRGAMVRERRDRRVVGPGRTRDVLEQEGLLLRTAGKRAGPRHVVDVGYPSVTIRRSCSREKN
jgi:hypothetical protein